MLKPNNKIKSDDPRTIEQFKNFIDNDDVMMAIYKDDDGTMYVALSDRKEPSRCIVMTAEAICKSTDILGDVFSGSTNQRTEHVLN